jgi:hypothetical protein
METIAARPSPAADGRPGAPPGRCPACGEGDLVLTRVARRSGEAVRAAYCAGVYDGRRRLVLRPSCGFAGPAPGTG